jgi:hypothetical protein
MKALRRMMGAGLRNQEPMIVLRRGLTVAVVVPAQSQEGQQLLTARRLAPCRSFLGGGTGNGEKGTAEEHDRYLFAQDTSPR